MAYAWHSNNYYQCAKFSELKCGWYRPLGYFSITVCAYVLTVFVWKSKKSTIEIFKNLTQVYGDATQSKTIEYMYVYEEYHEKSKGNWENLEDNWWTISFWIMTYWTNIFHGLSIKMT